MRHIIIYIGIAWIVFLGSCEKINLEQSSAQKITNPTQEDANYQQKCYVWNGHVVVGERLLTDGRTELLLLSLYEWSDMPSANHVTDSAMVRLMSEGYVEMELSDWRIPTQEEAKRLLSAYAEGSEALESLNLRLAEAEGIPLDCKARYLCNEGRKSFSFASGTSISNAGSKANSYCLRLLRQVVLP